MVETTSKPSVVKRMVRLVVLAVLSAAVAVPAALAISKWQDWQFRASESALSLAMTEHAISLENPPSPESFFPMQVVSRPPSVSDFPILSAEEAKGKIEDNELVLGVTINGESRAYPLNVLTGPDREVFNDQLGGRRIAATW